jgi:hypothetical protein
VITALTTFRLKTPLTKEQARDIFLSTAPRYQSVSGLIRKCYILSEDGRTAGGVYLWQSKADALEMYTESWHAFVREKYGSDAEVTYFETPVVVDNLVQQVLTDA